MNSKLTTYFLIILYSIFGAVLFFWVPQFDEVYRQLYDDWDTVEIFRVQAFHVSRYVWLLLAAGFVFVIYNAARKHRKATNIFFTVLLVVLSLMAFSWLYSYIFHHNWG